MGLPRPYRESKLLVVDEIAAEKTRLPTPNSQAPVICLDNICYND